MMLRESTPIVVDIPEQKTIEIFGIHDLHYGNECFDTKKWLAFKRLVLSEENRYVVFVGDLMENAVPNSKSDVFTQTATPREQQEFVEEMFYEFKDRTLAIVDGNHEFNRSTKNCGLYPLYSAACVARVEEKYRSAFAVVDVGFGQVGNRMSRVSGFLIHNSKDLKNFGTVDAMEGIDFMWRGHDHEPIDHPRGHLVYDRQRREVKIKSCEVLNSGSFLSFGGYGARAGFRPKSDKMFKLVLRSRGDRKKSVETHGFYLD